LLIKGLETRIKPSIKEYSNFLKEKEKEKEEILKDFNDNLKTKNEMRSLKK
jgi:hypothetical protein